MSKRRRVAAPSDSVLESTSATIFVTKKSTLSFENDSMLARLFDGQPFR